MKTSGLVLPWPLRDLTFADANGTITTFDPPGAGTGPGQGTASSLINPAGAIAGAYIDSSNVSHGFLRTP